MKLLGFFLVPLVVSGLLTHVANAETDNSGSLNVDAKVNVMKFRRGTDKSATSTRKMMDWKTTNGNMPLSPIMQGNGQPIVGGTISAVSGNTLTLTNKSNVTYTVDVSAATVYKSNATSSVSNLSVGDKVVVQGAVNGSAVTASTVVDQNASANAANSDKKLGFFGAIRGFFHSMFGFF